MEIGFGTLVALVEAASPGSCRYRREADWVGLGLSMLAEHVKAPYTRPDTMEVHTQRLVAVGNDVRAGGRATKSEAAGGGRLG